MPSFLDHIPWIKFFFFISLSVKQNLGHVWFLGPHTLGKLMFFTALNVKQNLDHAWFLRPLTLGKLMFFICLSDKHNFSYHGSSNFTPRVH